MNWLSLLWLILAILFVLRGIRKGFVRMLVGLVSMILVVALAGWLNPYISTFLHNQPMVYGMVSERCTSLIEDSTRDYEGELKMNTQVKLINELALPSGVRNGLLRGNNSDGYARFAVNSFTDYVAAYLTDLILSAAAFVISYIAAIILLEILLKISDLFTRLPGISLVNVAGGGIMGLVQLLFAISLFYLLTTVIAGTFAGQRILEATAQSPVLSYIYNNNPLWLVIHSLILG